MGEIMEEDSILKHIGPNTYKDKLLDISAQRMIFVIYHLMRLRDGDYMPNLARLNPIAEEHGIFEMSLEDLICYERWLRQGDL